MVISEIVSWAKIELKATATLLNADDAEDEARIDIVELWC